ncbi:MAG: hypothetical protein R2939_10595 [Kofleriaceae bacterium]
MFRLLPDIQGHWFDKVSGVGEHGLDAPSELQAVFAGLMGAEQIRRDLPPKVAFETLVKNSR